MRKIFILILIIVFAPTIAQQVLPPVHSFMQANNINTIFFNDGIYNQDKFTFSGAAPGFIWPVTAQTSLTADYTTGIWIGAKVGPQRELRLAAALYSSHYSAGNIPVIGQVPPSSVCNDSSWKVYLVNLNDQTLVNGGIRTKVAGGRTYTFLYSSWANWPISKGAPYAEMNGIPGYQPSWFGDRPGVGNNSKARPEEICFSVYMDYTNCTNNIHSSNFLPGGTLPIGAEIQQISFAFNCPLLNNMYYVKYRIINKSLLHWDSTYIGFFDDADIGEFYDDASGCDTSRHLSHVYNFDNNDMVYGSNPPVLGVRLLQSPLKFTNNPIDTAYLPFDTLIGYKLLGMTTHNTFRNNGCYSEPGTASQAYYLLKGLNACGQQMINPIANHPTPFRYPGDACNRTGWLDTSFPTGHDSRNFLASGPLTMNSGDTQIVVISFTITRDGGTNFQNVCALQSLSDSALKYYYNDFRTCIPIGIEPISNEVPDRFMLYQNYPNPFNPVTKVKFAIPPSPEGEGLGVRVIIYDILGREIATLVNENLQPGVYEVDWDATNYPSGVYFYQLTAPDFTRTNKMVLLK